MLATTKAWKGLGETVCLVPTMGNIHRGHLALIEKARKTAERVVVSIYVNPTQFGADEDFDRYPRALDADCDVIAAEGGCDVIYAPTDIYDASHATNIMPTGVALPMEGKVRPHFSLVLPRLCQNCSTIFLLILQFLAKKIFNSLLLFARWFVILI